MYQLTVGLVSPSTLNVNCPSTLTTGTDASWGFDTKCRGFSAVSKYVKKYYNLLTFCLNNFRRIVRKDILKIEAFIMQMPHSTIVIFHMQILVHTTHLEDGDPGKHV